MRRLCSMVILAALLLCPVAAGARALAVGVMAHRGLCQNAPENSLAALREAWRAGLSGSEIDLRASSDGVLLLMHDETLERTSNGQGRVAQKPWRALRGLRLRGKDGAPGPEPIPTLEQVLAWAAQKPGFRLALDLKQADPLEAGRLIIKHGLKNRVELHLGGPERAGLIRAVKGLDKGLRVSLNLGWWWRIEGLAAFAAQGTGADALFAPEWFFPARGFGEARKAGAEVQVYLWGRRNLAARFKAAVALGAQVVSSDYPLQLLPLAKPRPTAGEEPK